MNVTTEKAKQVPKATIDATAAITTLRHIGFGPVLAERILDTYGPAKTLEHFVKDPYVFMEVEGISFKRADGAAMLLGVKEDDPRRHRALLLNIFEQNSNFGHTYLPLDKLKKDLRKGNVVVGDVKSVLADMEEKKRIVVEDTHYFLAKYHRMEVDVADIIHERGFVIHPEVVLAQEVYWENYSDVTFDPYQIGAIVGALSHNTSIITGGPGTGKTTVTKTICDFIEKNELGSIALCAPTGKAAKRLEEVTGRKAFTIHRFFRAGFGVWKTGPQNMISCDWLIIDECSMLDIQLAWRILRATPRKTRIIFVGDKNQLPPVGPGAFLRDLIKSSMIPVCILRHNHRQGPGSLIAENALTINDGGMRLLFNSSDMRYEEAENSIIIREKLLPIIEKLGKAYGIDNVQILSPQKQTNVGVEALNKILRFKLNRHADAREKFSVGDRVMQTQNNYKLDIFNGYVGVIKEITRRDYVIEFFDKGKVTYPRSISDQLIHAYCCTVHKFQGSEVPAGILILSTSHTYMLTRNLIYTGMTRFKKCCVFLGDRMALRRSCTNTREGLRYTKLLERLVGSGGGDGDGSENGGARP